MSPAQEIAMLRQQLDAALRLCDEIAARAARERQACLTAEELAARLKVHKQTLYKLARRHQMPCFWIGHQWRISEQALLDWIEKMAASTRPPRVIRRFQQRMAA